MSEQNVPKFVVSVGVGQGRSGLARLFGAQAQKKSNLYDTNPKQVPLGTPKLAEKFAMMIPEVAIHGSISPASKAFVPAVRLKPKFKFIKMSSTNSIRSSGAPSWNPTFVR